MRLFVALLIVAMPCLAQPAAKRKALTKQPASDSQSWPLLSLTVTGNHIYTEKQILAVSGLKLGRPTSKSDFDAARARLFDTGAFESVGFQFGPTSDGKG